MLGSTMRDLENLLLRSYETIPREKINEEEKAVQELRGLFGLLEKKIKRQFGEQEERDLKENAEKWRKDITIIRDHISREIKKG